MLRFASGFFSTRPRGASVLGVSRRPTLRAVASSSRLLPTRPAKDFHLQFSAHARHTYALPPGRPGNGTSWQLAETPPKKRGPLSEQTRPPLLALLRRFRPFRDGTPPHDRLGDIFASLDAEKFQQCFVAWVASITGAPAGVIAIDGKTVRRSGQKKGSKAPIHMVSAFAARQRLVLGQVKVSEKSNEIVAIPKLLDMLSIEGAIVTIDAMGCQRDISKKIIEKKADYVLALKGNQGSLREDVEVFVTEQKASGFKDTTISQSETTDGE